MDKFVKICAFSLLIALIQGLPYKKGYGPGEQEWGHIDVRKGAHMFYWLFYVQDPKVTSFYDRPLVIWLQGGPGGSSTSFGNFEEIGPLHVNGSERSHSWAKHVNLLFIDNPVGTGFSYVDDLSLLTTDNVQIGKDMISFLTQFYKKFPKFEKTPFYIYCESYGGKMTVEIAKQLDEAIKKGKIRSNFKGVGLGDSWISPVDSVNTWAPFLYYTGMVDEEGLQRLNGMAKKVENAVQTGKFLEATRLWAAYEMDIIRETNNIDFYNIMYKVRADTKFNKKQPLDLLRSSYFDDAELQKLMEGPVKKALGIPSEIVHGKQSGKVFQTLNEDFMKPVIHVVEHLLNNTNLEVVVFTGNLDLIVDTPGTIVWMDKMRWKKSKEWPQVPRKEIVINNYIEGYVKNLDKLSLYWIHRAGHMVPTDNPETALEILRRSTRYDKI